MKKHESFFTSPLWRVQGIPKCAMITALVCILGPMSIPIGPIPVSLTNFVIFFSAYLLGFLAAYLCCIIWFVFKRSVTFEE